MRVSGDRNSVDYWAIHYLTCPLILLDGHRVDNCIMADDARGLVECHRVDESGNIVIDSEAGIFVTFKKTGKVEIVAPRNADSVN
jgi:hypothetical protein